MQLIPVYFFTFITVFFGAGIGFSQEMVQFQGKAPAYVGKKVAVFATEDYLTKTTIKLGETEVKPDSTFELSIYNNEIRRLTFQVDKNYFYVYAQPDASYQLFVSNKSPNTAVQMDGVEVAFYFLDLPKTDINYGVLDFEDQLYQFLQNNFNARNKSSGSFAQELNLFKDKMMQKYEADSIDFLKTYIRFSIAALDNLAFKGSRNKFEKYDFYIKPETVWYQNDRYMEYILGYYDKYASQLPRALNQQFYDAVVRSSPTLAMKVLGKDYALMNLRLREFVMLKMLRDVYYSGEYPETNVITILDSIATNGLFEANRPIAANLKDRLTDLSSGIRAPFFSIIVNGETKTSYDYQGKHLYIQFLKAGASKSESDIPLLKALYDKYGSALQVLTVVLADENSDLDLNEYIQTHLISWDCAFLDADHPMLEKFKVVSFPYYSLLDAQGYVVVSPALSPRPNNEYETIERTFFSIKKVVDDMQKE